MVGGPFQHDVCSSALNKNKYVEWDKKSHNGSTSVHIDYEIFLPIDKKKKNYAWICESSAIRGPLIERIKNNLDYVNSNFDLIFTHDRRLLDLGDKFKFTLPNAKPWIQNRQVYQKSKKISFIASIKRFCKEHHFRHEILHKFQHHVVHFGRGYSNSMPWTVTIDDRIESGKILGLKDFMFSFNMENANYPLGFSEKLTDCFATGTIPIYWGTRDVIEVFDGDGIIFLDDLEIDKLNEDLYLSKMEVIKKNLEIACELPSSEDYFYINYIK